MESCLFRRRRNDVYVRDTGIDTDKNIQNRQ